MRARLRLVALLAAGALAAAAVTATAVAQHRHRQRRGHHAPADPQPAVAEAIDAGAPAPTARASGGRPRQADAGTCVPGIHLASMRTPPPTAARPCDTDADCGLAQITCCPPCGEAGERDVVAVQVTAVGAWNEALCDGETTCPRCSSQMSRTLSAVCSHRLCEVRVTEDCGGAARPGPVPAPASSTPFGDGHWHRDSSWDDDTPTE